MNPKISYNPDHIHAWVNLPDLPKLVDLFIRRGFLKEAATCCQLLDHARKDPDVKDFYDDGNEVLLQLDIDTLHDKMDVCSVAVSPQFLGIVPDEGMIKCVSFKSRWSIITQSTPLFKFSGSSAVSRMQRCFSTLNKVWPAAMAVRPLITLCLFPAMRTILFTKLSLSPMTTSCNASPQAAITYKNLKEGGKTV